MRVDSLLNLVMPIPGSLQHKLTDWSSEIMASVSGGRGLRGSEPDWKSWAPESLRAKGCYSHIVEKALRVPMLSPRRLQRKTLLGQPWRSQYGCYSANRHPRPLIRPGTLGSFLWFFQSLFQGEAESKSACLLLFSLLYPANPLSPVFLKP